MGALNRYEEGLRQLWTTYGDWAVISQADVAMRSREWTIVHDEYLQEGKLDATRPWGQVMKDTSFGEVAGPRSHWWWLHVVGPLTSKSGNAAQHVMARLEQRPTNTTPIQNQKAASSSGTGNGKTKQAKSAGGKSASGEYCFAWNDGGCKFHCPEGRKHLCRFCNGGHRGRDCPTRTGGGDKGNGKAGPTKNKAKNDRKRKAGKGGQSAFRA